MKVVTKTTLLMAVLAVAGGALFTEAAVAAKGTPTPLAKPMTEKPMTEKPIVAEPTRMQSTPTKTDTRTPPTPVCTTGYDCIRYGHHRCCHGPQTNT